MTSGLDRPAGTAVIVRPMTPADVRFAAELHASCLPHGFFARLGRGFLRAYYRGFLASPHGVGFVAVHEGRRVGALVGTTRNREHYRWLARRRGLALGARGAAAMAARPGLAWFFLRTRSGRYLRGLRGLLWRGGPQPAPGGPASDPAQVAVLSHVAVSSGSRGSGAGRELTSAFLQAAGAAGAAEARLVTLAGPQGAARFYDALGWTRVGEGRDWDGRAVVAFARTTRGALDCE